MVWLITTAGADEQAPGGFTSQGELPQMDFARMGAVTQSPPTLCFKTKDACLLLCARRRNYDPSTNLQARLLEEGGPSSSGLHRISPQVGCLCLGAPGDALAQLAIIRKEAQNYYAIFGHDIPARVLAHRLADILQGKGQEAWTRPPACISILASWQPGKGPELHQVDPTGIVIGLKGAAIGGLETEKATKWLEGMIDKEIGCLKEGKEKEDEGQKGEGGGSSLQKVLETAWKGMKESWPSLDGHSDGIDVGIASAKGFRMVGSLSTILKPKTQPPHKLL